VLKAALRPEGDLLMDLDAMTASTIADEQLQVQPAPQPSGDAYMRGERHPVGGSIPHSTSKYLNSPLFVHAFTQRALRRYGHDVATTYDVPDMQRGIVDVVDLEEAERAITLEKRINPAFKAWVDRRHATHYDAADLRRYAPGTLGHAIHGFMVDSGLNINFMNEGPPPQTDLEYIRKRAGGSHDIQHIVTGFGPDPAGEQALAMMNVTGNARAFNPALARFISMPILFVSAATYARTCFNYPEGLPTILDATELGIRAGNAIRTPLILVDWEAYLDWSLDDIAADLGFERGPGAAWEITNETCLG
jgi:ubiquinone biosynthesis protein COQ4